MNKKTRTWLAVAAGGALLLGAGGTFATWSDQQTVAGGTIATGELALTAQDMSWIDASPDTDETPIDLDTFRVVPGDVLEGRTTVNATLVGDNLRAALTLGQASEIPAWLDAQISLDGDPLDLDAPFAVGQSRDVPLAIRISFPATEQAHQLDQVDLGALTVTLTQVRPTA